MTATLDHPANPTTNGRAPSTDLVPHSSTLEPRASAAMATPTMPLVPRTVDEALIDAKAFAASRMFAATTTEQALTILLTGMELGLGVAQSMRAFHVIEGKPSPSADTLVALCRRRPDICLYFTCIESSDEIATFETHRNGSPRPERASYTLENARKAGLLSKKNWQQIQSLMLVARCKAKLVRRTYEDLTLGLYTPEELGDRTFMEVEYGGAAEADAAITDRELWTGQKAAITAIIKAAKSNKDQVLVSRLTEIWEDKVNGATFKDLEASGYDLGPLLAEMIRVSEFRAAEIRDQESGIADGNAAQAARQEVRPASFRDEVQAKANVAQDAASPVMEVGEAGEAGEAGEEDDPFANDGFVMDAAQMDAAQMDASSEISAHQKSVPAKRAK